MTISTKLRAAAAGVLTFALLVGGATSALAAPGDPLNPQSNGSKGSFYLWNADEFTLSDGDALRVYTRDENLVGAASSTNFTAEINPSGARPVTGATPFTGVYRFISDKTAAARDGGISTWKAFAVDSATGPNGGTTLPNMTLNDFGPNVPSVIGTGGSFWYGVAYTTNNGLTTVGAVYRQIDITAGSGNYTVGAVEPGKPDTTTALSAPASIGEGGSATLTATVTPSAATGNVEFFDGTTSLGTASSAAGVATISASGLAVGSHSITAVYAGDSGYKTSTSSVSTVVVTGGPDEASLVAGANGNANGMAVTVNGVNATVTGLAAANGKTANVYGYPVATFLGQKTIASGGFTVNIATLANGTHKLAVVDVSTGSILGWAAFDVTNSVSGSPATRHLQAAVRTSIDGDFKLIAPDDTTPAVIGSPTLDAVTGESVSTGTLGAFAVVDDRQVALKGWSLSTDVAPFVNGSNTVANTALGVKPQLTNNTGPGTPTLGSEQVAGHAVYSSNFAELAAGTYSPRADLNAGLTFRAPLGTPAGTYSSTLTLTLVSK